jgi:hypothetical protein
MPIAGPDEQALKTLRKALRYVVAFGDYDWSAITDSTRGASHFSFAVSRDTAHETKSKSICIIIGGSGSENNLRLGFIQSVSPIATLDSRIVVTRAEPVVPATLDSLERALALSAQRSIQRIAQSSGIISAIAPHIARDIIDLFASIPDNHAALLRLASLLKAPARYTDARALQVDAIDTALEAFGLRGNEGAFSLELSEQFTALAAIRLQEDAVITHDARSIPGLVLSESDITGKATFRRGHEQLEVYTANKLPLEQMFGVDLIYHNVPRQAVIMVQYKILEPVSSRRDARQSHVRDWVFYQDAQFDEELERMRRFSEHATEHPSYRLNATPFYLKLYRRDASTRSTGIVLSVDHYLELRGAGQLHGPQGGVRLSYESLEGHYLRNDAFVGLIRSGYIGTTGTTTEDFMTLIRPIAIQGKPLVAAIQSLL